MNSFDLEQIRSMLERKVSAEVEMDQLEEEDPLKLSLAMLQLAQLLPESDPVSVLAGHMGLGRLLLAQDFDPEMASPLLNVIHRWHGTTCRETGACSKALRTFAEAAALAAKDLPPWTSATDIPPKFRQGNKAFAAALNRQLKRLVGGDFDLVAELLNETLGIPSKLKLLRALKSPDINGLASVISGLPLTQAEVLRSLDSDRVELVPEIPTGSSPATLRRRLSWALNNCSVLHLVGLCPKAERPRVTSLLAQKIVRGFLTIDRWSDRDDTSAGFAALSTLAVNLNGPFKAEQCAAAFDVLGRASACSLAQLAYGELNLSFDVLKQLVEILRKPADDEAPVFGVVETDNPSSLDVVIMIMRAPRIPVGVQIVAYARLALESSCWVLTDIQLKLESSERPQNLVKGFERLLI